MLVERNFLTPPRSAHRWSWALGRGGTGHFGEAVGTALSEAGAAAFLPSFK